MHLRDAGALASERQDRVRRSASRRCARRRCPSARVRSRAPSRTGRAACRSASTMIDASIGFFGSTLRAGCNFTSIPVFTRRRERSTDLAGPDDEDFHASFFSPESGTTGAPCAARASARSRARPGHELLDRIELVQRQSATHLGARDVRQHGRGRARSSRPRGQHDRRRDLPHPIEAMPLRRLDDDVGAHHETELLAGSFSWSCLERAQGLSRRQAPPRCARSPRGSQPIASWHIFTRSRTARATRERMLEGGHDEDALDLEARVHDRQRGDVCKRCGGLKLPPKTATTGLALLSAPASTAALIRPPRFDEPCRATCAGPRAAWACRWRRRW